MRRILAVGRASIRGASPFNHHRPSILRSNIRLSYSTARYNSSAPTGETEQNTGAELDDAGLLASRIEIMSARKFRQYDLHGNPASLDPAAPMFSPILVRNVAIPENNPPTQTTKAVMDMVPGLGSTVSLYGSSPIIMPSEPNRKKSKKEGPSAASGGVPNPSPQYLAQASLPPSRLPHPRKILVVMDLNGTLLYRKNKRVPSKFVVRTHTQEFLWYCLDTFVVAVWSSARPQNVNSMVDQLFTPEQRKKLAAVWGRDTLGLSKVDYNAKVQVYKRLDKLWHDPKVVAASGQRWDQTNTVLVDDSTEKARSHPFNAIALPEFKGDLHGDGLVLPQVHDYLNACAQQRDISSFIRSNPFAFDPNFTLSDTVQ